MLSVHALISVNPFFNQQDLTSVEQLKSVAKQISVYAYKNMLPDIFHGPVSSGLYAY